MSWNQSNFFRDGYFVSVFEVLLILQKVNKIFKWASIDSLWTYFTDTIVFAALDVVVKIAHSNKILLQQQYFALVYLIWVFIRLGEIPSLNASCYHFNILIFGLCHWNNLFCLFLRVSYILILMAIRFDTRSFNFFKVNYLFLFFFN